MSLSATSRLLRVSTARHTSPIPPVPMRETSRYGPNVPSATAHSRPYPAGMVPAGIGAVTRW